MAFIIFIIGLILGSFYLVIATRLPIGEDVLVSRSHCDYCKKELKWYNLIPLFSYVIQRGKCSFCGKKISIIYPIIELITGLSFMICFLVFGLTYEFYVGIIVISLTIIIYISDFKYMIILDSPLVISGVLVIILKYIYFGYKEVLISILSGIILFLAMLLVERIGKFLFKKDALGGGDIKLSFIIGLILGYKLGLVAIVLSTFLALPYSLAALYLVKKNEVPYGPFLTGALLIVFFTFDKFNLLLQFLFRF